MKRKNCNRKKIEMCAGCDNFNPFTSFRPVAQGMIFEGCDKLVVFSECKLTGKIILEKDIGIIPDDCPLDDWGEDEEC